MKIAVPKEIMPGERRVALIPSGIDRLAKLGVDVLVETGAGQAAGFSDREYEQAGARLVTDTVALFDQADVILKVRKPVYNARLDQHELDLMKTGTVLIAQLDPLREPDIIRTLAERRITSFSLDMIPRTTRAQEMDVLSSQATIAGYKAVLIAANRLNRIFPMLVTAAGTITPAKVLVLGAGVAGLQAIATARRLGAVVEAFDVRPAVKEQVESLGARFIDFQLDVEQAETAGGYARELDESELDRQRRLIHQHIKSVDVVITTAQVPGKPAPVLVTKDMVADMKRGAVIVDLAAETGGNCELTKPGEEIVVNDVVIVGAINLPSSVPLHASQMFSRNISNFLALLIADGKININFADEIVRGCCITHDGRIVHTALAGG